jgi:hypothetical protein
MPRTPMQRGAPLKRTKSLRQTSADAAVKALRRTERLAAKAGVELTEWEGEFLGSVAERVKTYGRAFGDPRQRVRSSGPLRRQAIKLKQIGKKVKASAPSGEPQPEPRSEAAFPRHDRHAPVSSR